MYQFHEAKPIWKLFPDKKYNQFVGFYTHLELDTNKSVTIAVAARSYYRLYVNGQLMACGPARSAEHFCRVDEIKLFLPKDSRIAAEVAAYSKNDRYSNDHTMEPGLFIAEITDETGNTISATGINDWFCKELPFRRSMVETMSHCRGIIEYYDLNSDSLRWYEHQLKERPLLVSEPVTFLKRRAPYPTYRKIPMKKIQLLCDMRPANAEKEEHDVLVMRAINSDWYRLIPEENCFLQSLREEKETVFSGVWKITPEKDMISVTPGYYPAAIVWEIPETEIGFLEFDVTVKETTTIDVLNSDHLGEDGFLAANTYASRYHLEPGHYHIISFEPKLIRYVKFIIRSKAEVKLRNPLVLEDSFPDDCMQWFQCSDNELNRIYDAARRTLRLNTLDIFMDCPERERGGWLCDSYFMARGAWQMFGNKTVEKDFLENFMLTDPKIMWNSFFPEVYPSTHRIPEDVGICNWSFWLMLQFCDYFDRTGDKDFVLKWENRVSDFVDGCISLRGESGLLENLPSQFVDWSMSNMSFALEPISIPINCLLVCMLEKLSVLYMREDWKETALEIRKIIEEIPQDEIWDGKGDAAHLIRDDEGNVCGVKRNEFRTESGIALEIWSGFHLEDSEYIKQFVKTMGNCPEQRADPHIAKANLFIGLMIRFDVLARLGKIDTLVKEWKDLYLEELQVGTGTFFEKVNGTFGCHGFNGYTGALITNSVLGLGMPMESSKSIKINPHPGNLKWANGSARCTDGMIYLHWFADEEKHILNMQLKLPESWTMELEIPFELYGWTILINGERIEENKRSYHQSIDVEKWIR